MGHWHRAIDFLEQDLLIAREVGYRQGEAQYMSTLGWLYQKVGEARRGFENIKDAIRASRDIGHRRSEGLAISNLAWLYVSHGEPHRAIELAVEARSMAREMGDGAWRVAPMANWAETDDWYQESETSWNLGLHYRDAGDWDRAIALMQFRVDWERRIGHTEAEAHAAQVEELRASRQAVGA